MDLQAWGEQRARYSRARHGRHERGAAVVECALIQAVTEAMGVRLGARVSEGGGRQPSVMARSAA